jgi:hypothetical protein
MQSLVCISGILSVVSINILILGTVDLVLVVLYSLPFLFFQLFDEWKDNFGLSILNNCCPSPPKFRWIPDIVKEELLLLLKRYFLKTFFLNGPLLQLQDIF